MVNKNTSAPLNATTLSAIEQSAADQVRAAVTRGAIRGAADAFGELAAKVMEIMPVIQAVADVVQATAETQAPQPTPGPTPYQKAAGHRRSAATMLKIADDVLKVIVDTPGLRAKQIAKAMGLTAIDIRDSLTRLRDGGHIRISGTRQGTTYYPVGNADGHDADKAQPDANDE